MHGKGVSPHTMANICSARLVVEPLEQDATVPLPFDTLKERLEAISYEYFNVCTDDTDEYLEVSCGFRWAPPFDALLAVTADLHVRLRCLYEEEGCGFMGAWRAVDGVVSKDSRIDYY